MRRLISIVDQLPGLQFVIAAMLLLAGMKAWWMGAQLARNPGASDLGGTLLLAGTIILSIFAIRRRQTGVWDAAAQVILAIAGANMLSYIFLIPFLPPGSTGEVARLLRGGLGETLVGIGLVIPVQAAGLWLSRRYGTHSAVTERRVRGEVRAGARASDPDPDIIAEPAGPESPHRFDPVTGRAESP